MHASLGGQIDFNLPQLLLTQQPVTCPLLPPPPAHALKRSKVKSSELKCKYYFVAASFAQQVFAHGQPLPGRLKWEKVKSSRRIKELGDKSSPNHVTCLIGLIIIAIAIAIISVGNS